MDILRLLKIALLVAVTAALTTATVLMVTQARVPATAVGPAPCLDGDVNGDTLLDVGDPIYLLTHLFSGGPSPVACAQTTPADVEAAVGAALARFLPQAGDRVFISEIVPSGTSLDLVVVPPGKVFMLEMIGGTAGGWSDRVNNGASFDSSPYESRPAIPFYPGETVTNTNSNPPGSGSQGARLWGYWLDYSP